MYKANEGLSPDVVADFAKKVTSGFGKIRKVSDIASRKSIMTMAQPGMFQYPLLVSNGIDNDALMLLVKAYQLTYASSVATAFSLNPIMDPDKTAEISDFVQTFHTNNASILNANLQAASKSLGLGTESYSDIDPDTIVVESATIKKDLSNLDAYALNLSAWDTVTESLNMESLNNMYKPYTRTERILREKLETIKAANEGLSEKFDKVTGIADDIDKAVNYGKSSSMAGKKQIYSGSSREYGNDPNNDKNYTDQKSIDKFAINKVIKEKELAAMEPTIVNVNVIIRGQNSGNIREIPICVKVMPRLITSNLMIASMIEACRDSHAIFKFLKWTKGEQKTLDFILGISESKKKALEKNAKQEVKLLEQCKKRKKINGVGKFLNNRVLPTASIVITTYEASKIKEACGVDLNNLREALKLMSKYYLLSLGIYDPDQGSLKVLFDCDSDWGYTVIQSLKSAVSKTNDLLNQNEVLKIFGRR